MEALEPKPSGYDYSDPALAPSSVTLSEFAMLKQSARFTEVDAEYLRLAGDVLEERTGAIVSTWRSEIIASIPHLARHSRALCGGALPAYLAASNKRFERWILDTCRRPYDQQWLNYQQEIALRHTRAKKNLTDGVVSTDHIPLRDIVAFVAVMNETIRPFLAAGGYAESVVDAMHSAWQKSLQLQLALWIKVYMDLEGPTRDW